MRRDTTPTVKSKPSRVLPPVYLMGFIVAMVALHFALPLQAVVAYPWTLLGLLPAVIGVALNLLSDAAYKRCGTIVKPFEESIALVTDGCFRYTRNPMYLGMTLLLLGLGVFLGTLTPLLLVPVFPVLMEMVFIRPEERMLEKTFGGTYQTYKTNVRRWI